MGRSESRSTQYSNAPALQYSNVIVAGQACLMRALDVTNVGAECATTFMLKRVDTASKLIRASASRIYEAFATPNAMKTWLPPEGMTGRVLAFAFRDNGGYRMRLTYKEAQHTPGKTSADAEAGRS